MNATTPFSANVVRVPCTGPDTRQILRMKVIPAQGCRPRRGEKILRLQAESKRPRPLVPEQDPVRRDSPWSFEAVTHPTLVPSRQLLGRQRRI